MANYTKSVTIKYSGSAVNPAELTGDEIFAMFKESHDVDDEATNTYNAATGLLTYQVTKLGADEIMYMQVWETKEAYDAWKSGYTSPNIQPGWTVS